MKLKKVINEIVTTGALPPKEDRIPKRLFGNIIRRCFCGFQLKKKNKICPDCGELVVWKKLK